MLRIYTSALKFLLATPSRAEATFLLGGVAILVTDVTLLMIFGNGPAMLLIYMAFWVFALLSFFASVSLGPPCLPPPYRPRNTRP